MQRISFAPVLSATLSRDSCWIIGFSWLSSWFSRPRGAGAWPNWWGSSLGGPGGASGAHLTEGSLGLLEDLDQAPALGGGQRAGLHDQDPVADAALVGLVVRLQARRLAHDLAVERVLHAVLDGHDDGLVHLVAHDEALAGLALVALLGRLGRSVLAHAFASSLVPGVVRMPSSRSRTTV